MNFFSNWSISTNSAYHQGGRIWILWQAHEWDINFLEYDAQFIHMTVLHKRPWAIGGDFNCVLTEDERVGGSFSRQDAEDFRQCLHQCEVLDSPAMGALYTWNNKQCPADRVYSRMDRFLVNQEWLNEFPLLYAHFLPEGTFDHTPCVVQANLPDEKRSRPFKYFNMWSLDPNFKETIQVGWNCMQTGTKMYELARKLKNLKQGLKQLNKTRFADIKASLCKACFGSPSLNFSHTRRFYSR
ncbi:uncharacterized protein LOC141640024 [Silene latifolia]|uniref:uncharacterized protein LOC141640024 n=1 Tax=Silene latifolia TaxID=37657 RepID=UPI003D76A925